MKKFSYHVCCMILGVFLLASCSKDSLEEMPPTSTENHVATVSYNSLEMEVLKLINDYRAENDLSELEFLDEISYQARTHNLHMIKQDEVCHDQFGSRYSALVNSIQAKAVSENVAYGYRTAEAMVNAWIKSDGHRENIIGNHTHFGISIEADEDGKFYATNIFVRK